MMTTPGLLLILTAGLIDGINPCAMGTIIILLAYLAMRRKKQSDLVICFIVYTVCSFLTYFLIGLGAFGFLYQFSGFFIVATCFKYFTIGIALIFGAASFWDAWQIYLSRKSGGSIAHPQLILQLPPIIHTKIRNWIRDEAGIGHIWISSALLGIVVTCLELNCTGQVYLPSILYMIHTGNTVTGIALLFAYNFSFILPLVVLGLLVISGISLKKFGNFFQTQLIWVKVGLGVFFITLAAAYLWNG